MRHTSPVKPTSHLHLLNFHFDLQLIYLPSCLRRERTTDSSSLVTSYIRAILNHGCDIFEMGHVGALVPFQTVQVVGDVKYYMNYNECATNHELLFCNMSEVVYVTHNSNEIFVKVVGSCVGINNNKEVTEVGGNWCSNIPMPDNSVSEKESQIRDDSSMLSDIGNEYNNSEAGHASTISGNNHILVQSSESKQDKEMKTTPPPPPSPVGRAFSAPSIGRNVLEKTGQGGGDGKQSPLNHFISVGVQVSPSPQYRLRFLPICGCSPDESEWEFCHLRFFLRLIGRWCFSQCGLGILLFVWALLGAAAFQHTEGPREEEQAKELRKMQEDLVVDLTAELRKSRDSRETVNHEQEIVKKYLQEHERLLLLAVSSGYGEGGGGGKIWTYAGCILFAVSLLTTLGFGAPVPRTTLGRIAAVLFSAIGIPLHLLLVLNIGMLIAVKLQSLATKWQPGTSFCCAVFQCCCQPAGRKSHCPSQDIHPIECHSTRPVDSASSQYIREKNIHFHPPFTPPCWLKWFPVVAIISYYMMGVLIFGVGRGQPVTACLLFPLDFTAAGGVGLTSSTIRTCYAVYLEGAVTLAAISVSILQVSASKGLVNLGLKLGLLTNS